MGDRLWQWLNGASSAVQHRRYFLLFFILINLGFVGLLSPWYVVRWDAYDYWLPRLHWMGDALRAGFFPDYFPYIFSGYSLGGDVQAGVYNPIYLLVAFLFADTTLAAAVLYLFFLSAIYLTVYRIGLSVFRERFTAFYAAMSVVVCGAVLPHSSHFSFLASYAGILGIAAGMVDVGERRSGRGMFLIFLSTWFLFTSGYATLWLCGAVVLFGAALFIGGRSPRFWLPVCFSAVLGLVFAGPALRHFFALMPLTDRADGQTLDVVRAGSLPLSSLWGFVIPFVTFKPASLNLSLAQFNVLISTPILFVLGLVSGDGWSARPSRRTVIVLLSLFVLFTILCCGSFSPLPIRIWLAEYFRLFRMGRYVAVEFKIFALMIAVYFAGLGLEVFWRSHAESARAKWVAILLLDILVILIAKRRFVVQEVDTSVLPPMKVTWSASDQVLFDEPRDCPEDRKTVRDANTSKVALFGSPRFSADGFSPMSLRAYRSGFANVASAVCGGGRLFSLDGAAVPYSLISYSPAGVSFHFAAKAGDYLWTETLDPYWTLRVNGETTPFIEAPAALRAFHVAADGEVRVEMTYRGPVSRFFRN